MLGFMAKTTDKAAEKTTEKSSVSPEELLHSARHLVGRVTGVAETVVDPFTQLMERQRELADHMTAWAQLQHQLADRMLEWAALQRQIVEVSAVWVAPAESAAKVTSRLLHKISDE